VFRSLRSKLITSYTLVILICLVLAGSAFVLILRDYQRQIRLAQLADMVQPLYNQVRLLDQAGASREQIFMFLQERAAESGIRILLVDPTGLVVEDTSHELANYRIDLPGGWEPRDRYLAFSVAMIERQDREGFVFIAAATRPSAQIVGRTFSRLASHRVVLAVPEQSLTASWLELAPSLSVAALVSLLVSIGVAVLLSRSISRPIAEITHASEEMAKGNYEQHIPVRNADEVGRLAQAFNHMAGQVSASNRTLRDLLANVSHELRTPLTSVQGFSQAMLDGTVRSADEYASAAQIINEESGRMRQLVEDLLLLSKIESGQLPMQTSPVDLRDLLRACLRRSAPRAEATGVSMEMVAQQPVEVAGDEVRLEQLFGNLLENAIRHTPPGGAVTVRVGARAQPPYGGGEVRPAPDMDAPVTVSVHNTGSFIPMEHQERVFERFYQVEGSRARTEDGSGLGLAIAREIANAHGARIAVQSDPQAGTTFMVAFNHQLASNGRQ
jgi:two-component system, OmpR family, sensor kinase